MKKIELYEKNTLYYLANTLNEMAAINVTKHDYSEAEQNLGKALAIFRELSDAYPTLVREDVAMTLHSLGLLHHFLNKYNEAEREYAEATEIYKDLSVENSKKYLPRVAKSLNELAYVCFDLGKTEESLKTIEDAISADADNPEYYDSKGELLLDMGKVDQALAMWNKVLMLDPDFRPDSAFYLKLKMKGLV